MPIVTDNKENESFVVFINFLNYSYKKYKPMKKSVLFLLLISVLSSTKIYSQWDLSTNQVLYRQANSNQIILKTSRTDNTFEGTLNTDGWGNFGFSNKVGIATGTLAPTALLDVYTKLSTQSTYNSQSWSTSFTGYSLRLQTVWNPSGVNYNFVQQINGISYNSLSFFSGNIGIGISNPTKKLHVYNTNPYFEAGIIQTPNLPGSNPEVYR